MWCARAVALCCAVLAAAGASAYTVDCNHEYTDCDTELRKMADEEELPTLKTSAPLTTTTTLPPITTDPPKITEKAPEEAATEETATEASTDRSEPPEEIKPHPRLLNLNMDELQNFANALHNQTEKTSKKLIDLSDVTLDDDDEDLPKANEDHHRNKDISDKFFSNLQAPFHALMSGKSESSEVEMCRENEVGYKIGDKIDRGCEESCECTVGGIFECSPRCKHPYIRRGRRLNDPLCFESPVDACCSIIACATGNGDAKITKLEVCKYNNETYAVGARWFIGCESSCVCEANSIVTCMPRCKRLPPSDKCINVQDPSDACCEVQVCDVSQDAHEITDNVTSTTTSAPHRLAEDNEEEMMSNKRPLVLAEPIGSIKVLQNNSVQVNLIHPNNSDDPIHLLMSEDGGKNFQDVELKYSNLILDLEGGKDYIVKTKETGTKFNFTITASDGQAKANEMGKHENVSKVGCMEDGKFYEVGEEFRIGCTELCECTGADTRECVALVCPNHVGLEIMSKGCVKWAPSPPAQPPNCCPRSARCLSDGTCHYNGVPVPNWSEVPISLTGCEQRCFCENGELDCQEVCSELPPVPPQTLRCPPLHRPAAVNISDEDCCKQWGCLPIAGKNGSQSYSMPTYNEATNYVTPISPIFPSVSTQVPVPPQATDPMAFHNRLNPFKTHLMFMKTVTPIPASHIDQAEKYRSGGNVNKATLSDDASHKTIQLESLIDSNINYWPHRLNYSIPKQLKQSSSYPKNNTSDFSNDHVIFYNSSNNMTAFSLSDNAPYPLKTISIEPSLVETAENYWPNYPVYTKEQNSDPHIKTTQNKIPVITVDHVDNTVDNVTVSSLNDTVFFAKTTKGGPLMPHNFWPNPLNTKESSPVSYSSYTVIPVSSFKNLSKSHHPGDNITVFPVGNIMSPIKTIQSQSPMVIGNNYWPHDPVSKFREHSGSIPKSHTIVSQTAHSHPDRLVNFVMTGDGVRNILHPSRVQDHLSDYRDHSKPDRNSQEISEKLSDIGPAATNLRYFIPTHQKKFPPPPPSLKVNTHPKTIPDTFVTPASQYYFEPIIANRSDYILMKSDPVPNSFPNVNPKDHTLNSQSGKHVTILKTKVLKAPKSSDVYNEFWTQDTKAHVLTKQPNPYETVLLRAVQSPKHGKISMSSHKLNSLQVPSKAYSAIDLEHLLNQMEVQSEVNRNLGRSADKNQGSTAGQPPHIQPEFPAHKPQTPAFLPTIPPEPHYSNEDDYDQNNIHHPVPPEQPGFQGLPGLQPGLTGLPPGLQVPSSYGDMNKKLSVISIESDSMTSIKMLLGLPPVLVGLRGSVDLRYTDKADEDVTHWYSQVFAPADEVLTTPRLEFRLTGLKPSTTYKVQGKLYLHNLPVSPESDTYSVRTQDLPVVATAEEKRREINSGLTVVDVNDTTAHVSWKHFSEDELQFIDGIQVRYRPVGTPIYSMTELLHHSRSAAELHDLRPDSRYEASLVLIPPPRATTELHDPNKIEFTTAPYIDPYNWTVVIEARSVGAEAAELTWRGVPSPAERWVRVYRAAHACGDQTAGKEHDEFRLAARDQPPSVTLSGLAPDTRCRVWLELFLTNGKVKTSNVLEINTKPLDTDNPIDNEIEASGQSGSARGRPRGDYYTALVGVGVVAALGALTSLLLLLVVVRRHRPRSVPITPVPSAPRESSLPPYDNPAYKLELQQETMDL